MYPTSHVHAPVVVLQIPFSEQDKSDVHLPPHVGVDGTVLLPVSLPRSNATKQSGTIN
jgi:hypothetical protein